MHRSATNIRFRSRFVFLLCFWKCGFSVFKCNVLVKLGRAILDQVCSVHEILPLWLRIDQWTVKYNFLYGKIKLDRILWHYDSMHFVCFIQNPLQDTWAAVLSELFRIESTVYFSQNLLWTPSSASLCCEHSVSFWVCLSVVFLKMRLFYVQMHCFREVRKSDSRSSLLSARNPSVMITNWSVNCQVQFSVRENQPGSNSVT